MSSETYAQGDCIDAARAGQTGQKIRSLMTDQKNRAADGLQRLAGRVRTTATTPSDAAGQLAGYRNGAAAGLESMATYVRAADVPTVLRDARRLARRPEVLAAGAFLTGLLVARFLRVPTRRVDQPWRAAADRWREALQKGALVASAAAAQAASSAADTLRQTAESRGFSPETVVERVASSRLGKQLAIVGDHLMRANVMAATLLKNAKEAAAPRLT
jgi:hypothetical protein